MHWFEPVSQPLTSHTLLYPTPSAKPSLSPSHPTPFPPLLVDALVRALQVFPGGVVVVSHDARLISSLECEIWVCQGGLIHEDGIEGTGIRVERRGFEYYR